MTIRFTSDLSDEFFRLLRDATHDLPGLAEVIYAESGARSDILNHAGSGAVGLIQFMPSTLRAWGFDPKQVAKMTPEQQMPLVCAYMKGYRPSFSLEQTYCFVFMPADAPQAANPDHVLVQKVGFRSWAWAQNAQLDADGDEKIQVRELRDAVMRQCAGPRWREYAERAGLAGAVREPSSLDLQSTYGLQVALLRLGFAPGPLDGVPGKRLTKAILAFQNAKGLVPDGIPGPRTRATLASSLAP